jgi:hypothetical protein
MAATSHQRAGMSERGVSARRLALAAALSGLVHLLLWGGLTTTRLTLLGSKPQDATAAKPALKPKLAADFPLHVPKSPSAAKPAHERPLDMQVAPRKPQEPPRPAADRVKPPAVPQPEPEQPLPVAVTPPALARSAAPRDTAPEKLPADQAAALERQRLDAAAAPAAATAAQVAAAPGTNAAAAAPKPASLLPRPTEQESASVARRRPREVAMAPAVPDTPPLPPRLPQAAREEVAPQPQAVAKSARRAVAVDAAADSADAPPQTVAPISPPVGTAAASPTASAAPRPQSPTTSLTDVRSRADRGNWAPLRSPTAAAAADSPATAQAGAAATAPAGSATGLTVARPDAAQTSAGSAAAISASETGAAAARGAVSPAPLVRSSPVGAAGSGAMAATNTTAAAIAIPAAGAGDAATAAGGGDKGTPMPAAMPRLGSRPTTATRSLAGPTTATGGAGVETDGEELSSVAEAGALSATGAGAGVVGGDLAGRDRGNGPEVAIAPQPLGRVAAVTLPVEGRVREIAIPFARRSRANRDARGREQPEGELVIREKTRVAADAMVDRGLDFLARAQQPDGRWRLGTFPGATAADTPKLSCDTAATGLAILSFLGAGHDHFGGRHRDTVRRGLEFLLSVQKPDGDLYLPSDKLSDSCAWLYSHGIASMALCEAVGMTGDPLIKPAAARACGFIAASQHPTRGGWRYTPRSDADLSVSGWMLVALRSGRLAGVEVEPQALDGVKTLLEASAITGDPAKYHYNPRNTQQRPSQLSAGCMTAVGTLMRLHTGWTASDPRVQQSARALASLRPGYGSAQEKTRDCYLWYYASQVLVHTGGDEWTDWYDQLAATLEQTQERQGPRAGSWDPLGAVPDRWGQYGGRIYVTALHLLALEVPDRRLPTYGSPDDRRDDTAER